MTLMLTRRYSELARLDTFDERYEYLKLGGSVGVTTFGFDRYINQEFYRTPAWRAARRAAILRDDGCDLGLPGFEIHADLLVHHMNPMSSDDIVHGADWILDPEYLITTSKLTHNAIHYGDASLLPRQYVERHPGDTKLW